MTQHPRNKAIFADHVREVVIEVEEAVFGVKPAKQNVRWLHELWHALPEEGQPVFRVPLVKPAFIELVVFVEVRPDDTYRTQKQPRGAQQWVIAAEITPRNVLYILTFFGPARDTDPPAIVGSVLRFRTPEFTGE